jgi:hypothetical protein
MTTSPNDGEALTAIRKANALLAEANVNWEEFLNAVETTKQAVQQSSNNYKTPPSRRQRAPWDDDFDDVSVGDKFTDAAVINTMFERAYRRTPPNSSFKEFLDSIHAWFEIHGSLTEKQYLALKRSARM